MATIVVFHSALGLRPAIHRFAERLREDGHVVRTPELYGGSVFDDLDAGASYRDEIGIPELIRRAQAAVANLPDDLVYAGFSMGAVPAQLLAATRPHTRGALLMQGAAPLQQLGVDRWPANVPVQLHVAAEDPWFNREDAEQVVVDIPDTLLDYHEYASDGHLFFDEDWQDHDPVAAAAMTEAARRWLRSLEA